MSKYLFPKLDYPLYFRQLYRRHGLRAVIKQFRKPYRRPFSRGLIKKHAPRGIGLEIGVGAQTIAPLSRTVLSDRFSQHAQNESLARVFFSSDAVPYPDNTFAFILSEHVLEHVPDPIKTLKEWLRVLQPGGKLFLFLPHKDRTFDRERPRTAINHLWQDYEKQVNDSEDHHLKEWMDLVIARGLAPHYAGIQRHEMLATGCLHRHVWITEDIVELFRTLGIDTLESHDKVSDRTDSFVVVGEKRSSSR